MALSGLHDPLSGIDRDDNIPVPPFSLCREAKVIWPIALRDPVARLDSLDGAGSFVRRKAFLLRDRGRPPDPGRPVTFGLLDLHAARFWYSRRANVIAVVSPSDRTNYGVRSESRRPLTVAVPSQRQ
jgi:hypothetical protein